MKLEQKGMKLQSSPSKAPEPAPEKSSEAQTVRNLCRPGARSRGLGWRLRPPLLRAAGPPRARVRNSGCRQPFEFKENHWERTMNREENAKDAEATVMSTGEPFGGRSFIKRDTRHLMLSVCPFLNFHTLKEREDLSHESPGSRSVLGALRHHACHPHRCWRLPTPRSGGWAPRRPRARPSA